MLVLPHCVGDHMKVIQLSYLTSVTAPHRVLLITIFYFSQVFVDVF